MERIIVLVFALFVLLNEIILGFSGEIGAAMYLVLMSVALILLSRGDILDSSAQMIVVLLAVPLVKIAVLFMDIPYAWKVSLGAGIVLFLGVYYLYKFDIDIGVTLENLWMLPVVIFLGFIVGILGNFGFVVTGEAVLIMILPLVVFSEEVFFRGLMQNLIEKNCSIFYSIVVPAVIYGALSLYLGIGLAIFFFIVSIFSGIVYFFTRNIFLSVAFSLSVSIFIFIVPSLI